MTKSFVEKGGLWVIVQMGLLLVAGLVPWYTGAPALEPDPARMGGLALMLAGGLLFVTGVRTLGDALTPYPYPRDEAQLRTTGAYAFVRHPLYSGLLITAFGWTLLAHSVYGVITWVILFFFFDRKAAKEEVWLTERHPDYAAYRARIKKLIPWIY